jgi:hypothetical protein
VRRHLSLILTLALLAAAGCGDSENSASQSSGDLESPKQNQQSAESVSADDTANVLQAQDSINTACGLTRDQQGSDVPLEDAIRTLQNVYRANPDGTFAAGVSYSARNMETIVEASAATLRKCGKTAEAGELASVLKS